MIKARYVRPLKRRTNSLGGNVSQQISARRGPDLIIDNGEAIAFPSKTQHRFGEIIATCSKNPTGAKDQMVTTGIQNRFLSFQLGRAVEVQRAGRIGFHPRRASASVKYIISRIMDQPGPKLTGLASKHGGSKSVDNTNLLRLTLGLIHSGMSGGIHDHIRRNCLNC